MITRMFSIYDSKVEAYLSPFAMQAKGAALREFTELANDKATPIGKNPEDYTLFEIGTFDVTSGVLVPHVTPLSLGVAIEFVKSC